MRADAGEARIAGISALKVALAIVHHSDAMNIALDGGRDAAIDEQSQTLLRISS
ncbi:MAG: hypothetical protein JNL06_12975 [Alphaproteobacteria bacterium]|nr:hypothetical protein [Alphaproteobacteria bacterium]